MLAGLAAAQVQPSAAAARAATVVAAAVPGWWLLRPPPFPVLRALEMRVEQALQALRLPCVPEPDAERPLSAQAVLRQPVWRLLAWAVQRLTAWAWQTQPCSAFRRAPVPPASGRWMLRVR